MARTVRRLGPALIGIGLLLVLSWLGMKGLRTYQAARRGMAHLETLQEMAQRPPETLLDDPQALEGTIAGLSQEMATVRAETRFLDPLLKRLSWIPRYGPELAATPHLTALAANLSAAGADLVGVTTELLPIAKEGDEDSLVRSIELLQTHRPTLERAQAHLQQAHYESYFVDPARLDDGVYAQAGSLVEQLDPALPAAVRALGVLNALLPRAGLLLGMEAPQRYLLLGQSNYELRATGGFLGSMGPVTVSQGRIVALDYRRSPEWDDPGREKVQPPWAFERYMLFGAWYIRDANWYADFPTSAQKIEWFWELDGHDPVDGVIAVDLYAVENLLEVIGPLEVPGYGITVGGPDALERIWEGHRQDKQRFLSALVETAAARLEQPDLLTPKRLLALVEALGQSLEEKHILLYFDEATLQEAIVEAGWGGAIRDDPGDFLMVVDSDFSWSEVTRFVDEEIHYQVTLDPDLQIQESTVTLSYWNHFDRWVQGGTNEPFGGACFEPAIDDIVYHPGCYGNYIQLFLPLGSRFISAEGFDDGMEYREESGHNVIAGYLRVFPGEQRTVSVTYVPPTTLVSGNYYLTLQKQPGTEARPVEIDIQVSGSQTATAALHTDLRTDRVIVASWQEGHLLISGRGDLPTELDRQRQARQQAFAEGLDLWEAGQRDQAIAHWQRHDVAGLILDQANLLRSRGRLEEAAALCQTAVELDPDSSRAHFLLGKVSLQQGDTAGALDALETSVALDPENRSARLELGLLYEALGDAGQAGQHLPHADQEEAIHILWRRVWEHWNGGEAQASLDAVELILLLDPHEANAHFFRAGRLRALQRYPEALAAYEQAHQAIPGDVRYYIGRAHVYADQGQGEAAIADLEEAVKEAPRSAEAWFHLGRYRWRFEQDAAGAVAALEQAVELYPNAWYATTLGNVHRAAGDLEAAVEAYERATTLPGHNARTWATLAQAYEAAGRTEEAIAAYETALEQEPENETWQEALERLRE